MTTMNASAAAGPAATKPERLSSAVSDVGRFAIVPTWLLTSGVSDRAVRLYACLAGQYANYDTKEAFPLRRTLATDLGCSLSSADRAIDELTQIGALLVEQRQASTGDYISNIYRIRIATPDGLVRDAVLESPAPAEGGVYSPVTRGVYSPVTRGLFTGDDTESSTTRSTKQDQVRTPPPPADAGARTSTAEPSVDKPKVRPPTRGERAAAQAALAEFRADEEQRYRARGAPARSAPLWQQRQELARAGKTWVDFPPPRRCWHTPECDDDGACILRIVVEQRAHDQSVLRDAERAQRHGLSPPAPARAATVSAADTS